MPAEPFPALLERMVSLIDGRLTSAQRSALAGAMPAIRWEFPDAQATLCLAATAECLRVAPPETPATFLVRMDRSTLEDAAFGRRSLGVAFLAGRIHVRGMNPLRLREFIMLVDPLLESYREASLDHSHAPSPPVS